MEQHFNNDQINLKFQGKGIEYYCWELKKRKVKNAKIFKNYSSRLARALSTIRPGRTRVVEEMVIRKLTENLAYLKIPK